MTGAPEIHVLYSQEEIAERVKAIATKIRQDELKDLLFVAVLKGSFIFAADLARALHEVGVEPEIEFLHLSSYGANTVSSGTVTILKDIASDVSNRDVILVDDILESGRTLRFAADMIKERGAKSVRVAALLDKPMYRKADIEADYKGFDCPDKFVVGYGMDMGHAWRQLPFIGFIPQDGDK
ncbi:hypoxanthine phosphoribosyltransferase [Flexibacterium corallicola]|uniref:hypoxanthine phosphoribosyltransferase n=1 Tax=Flexibacterium corallicola TaxID=3037259 RepID=UPI00286EEFF3|nr:hypoxanthine phosphoribosyltransferase [Pseudovibrio sp. M1P-2-3]